MPENNDKNEVVIEIETEDDKKPDFLIDDSEEQEDVSTESDEVERTIETVEAELEALKEDFKRQLESVAEGEREQYEVEREKLLRTAAEAENTKRRVEIDAQKQLKFANRTLIEGLIPVLDSLDAAIKSVSEKDDSNSETSSDIANFSQGVELVQKQFLDVLKIHGLTPIHATDGQFDPNLHEAVFATASDEIPEGNVIEEFRCGFQLHDQVLRAAQVVVSKGEPEKKDDIEDVDEDKIEDSSKNCNQ